MLLRLAASIGGGGMDCGLAPQVISAAPRDAVTFVGLVLLFPTICGTSPAHTPFVLANILKDALRATFSAVKEEACGVRDASGARDEREGGSNAPHR